MVAGKFDSPSDNLKHFGAGLLLGLSLAAGVFVLMKSELDQTKRRIAWFEEQARVGRIVNQTQAIFNGITMPEPLAERFRALGYRIRTLDSKNVESPN